MPETIARQFAIDTRLKLGLQSTEFFDVYRAINSLGITCIIRPLESKISGATFRTNKVQIIFVNSCKSLGHQNFTIAHELYHCRYDNNLTNRACSVEQFQRTSKNERIADYYAAHLLMPEDGIFNQLRLHGKLDTNLKLADVINLEQYFGVSRKAICWRLEELKLINMQECNNFSCNVLESARLLGKDISLYKPTMKIEIISDYAEKAWEALEQGLITEARYEEILNDADLLDTIRGRQKEPDIAD